MQTYISILRGINVSGQKMIKMDALKKMYEDAGFKNVTTYIQSGNVIFQTKETSNKKLEEKISVSIKKRFSFDVPVIVKTIPHLEEIFNNNPFIKRKGIDVKFLYATFLADIPTQSSINTIKGDFGEDEFIVIKDVVYLCCPKSYGTSKLNNNFFENKLKLTATTRNWKTVTELVTIVNKI